MQRMLNVISLLALAMWVEQAVAEQPVGPWEKWNLSVGAYAATLGTDVRVGTPGVGAQIDLENVLGLDSSETVVRIDAAYRFGSSLRHRWDFTWYDLSRDATRTLTEDINVDGKIYPIGTTVDSKYDLAFYNVRYSYSFLQDDRVDFAGSVGFHVTHIGLAVQAAGIGTAGDVVTAPLPLVGGRLDVALTERWYVRSSIEFMYLKFGDFKGQMTDMTVGAEYRAWKNFAIGGGLNSVRLSLDADKESSGVTMAGDMKSNILGLTLYGKLMF